MIIGYEFIKEILDNIIRKKELPNLIFNGGTGSGKKFLVHYLVDKLYGEYKDERVLYLSICDERGISTIREKIKCFANMKLSEIENIPSYKVIIFDHAEHISQDAQNALRRIIEMTNNLTRFIFITKNIKIMIEPIISRCILLHLKFLENNDKIKIYKEKYKLQEKTIKFVIHNSNNNFDEENNRLKDYQFFDCYEKKVREIAEKIKNNLHEKMVLKDIVDKINEIKKETTISLFEITKCFYKMIVKEKLKHIFEINDIFYTYNKNVNRGGCIYMNSINFYSSILKYI